MEKDEIKLEYIRIQWADIHHSRNQVWQALVIIAGIYASIGQLNSASIAYLPLISAAGALISTLAYPPCELHLAPYPVAD